MVQTIVECLPMALCMLAGAVLVLVEVFLPGFGLPGIAGVLLIGTGTVLAGMHFGSLTAVGVLLVLVAVLAVLISWALRTAARSRGKRSELFLQEKDELHQKDADMQVLVGKCGRTSSVLRPAGIGDFDGVRLNVVTEGDFIESGRPIEIARVEGARIVVRARPEG